MTYPNLAAAVTVIDTIVRNETLEHGITRGEVADILTDITATIFARTSGIEVVQGEVGPTLASRLVVTGDAELTVSGSIATLDITYPTFRYGDEAPLADNGRDGDSWLDTETGKIYSKADGEWTEKCQLVKAGSVTDVSRPYPQFAFVPNNTARDFEVGLSFSKAVTGLETDHFLVTGATVTGLTGSGADYVLALSATANLVTVQLPADSVADESGNTNMASNTGVYTTELVGPTATVVPAVTSTRTAFTATVYFSSSVVGFTADDVAVTGATVTSSQISGSEYRLTFTPTLSSPGNITFFVADGAGVAATGMLSSASATHTVGFNNTTFSGNIEFTQVTTPGYPINNNPIIARVTFTRPVVSLPTSAIAVTNANVVSTEADGSAFLVTLVPISQGAVSVGVQAGTVTDSIGNHNTEVPAKSIVFDSVGPRPTIPVGGGFTSQSSYVVNLQFDEDVVGVGTNSLTVTNATVTNVTANSARSYLLTLSATADGLITYTVPSNICTDLAGNSNSNAIVTGSVTYDSQPPVPTLSQAVALGNDQYRVTMTTSEPIQGSVTAAALSLSGLTVGAVTAVSTTEFRFNLTATTTGNLTVSVLANSFTDRAGNQNQASNTVTIFHSTAAPLVTISSPVTITAKANATLTASFTMDVTGLAIGDFEVTGGSLSSLTTVTAREYTFVATPTDTAGNSVVTVKLPAGAVASASEVDNEESNTVSVRFDYTDLTGVLTSPNTLGPINDSPLNFVISFSKPVSGLTASDFTVTNGTVVGLTLSASTDTSYTVAVTPTANGTVTLALPADSCVDDDDNANLAVASTFVSSLRGAVTATYQDRSGTTNITGLQQVIRITFDRAVVDFTSDKLTLTGGTVKTFTIANSSTYDVLVDVNDAGIANEEVVYRISANAVTDRAGNKNASNLDFTLAVVVDTTEVTWSMHSSAGSTNVITTLLDGGGYRQVNWGGGAINTVQSSPAWYTMTHTYPSSKLQATFTALKDVNALIFGGSPLSGSGQSLVPISELTVDSGNVRSINVVYIGDNYAFLESNFGLQSLTLLALQMSASQRINLSQQTELVSLDLTGDATGRDITGIPASLNELRVTEFGAAPFVISLNNLPRLRTLRFVDTPAFVASPIGATNSVDRRLEVIELINTAMTSSLDLQLSNACNRIVLSDTTVNWLNGLQGCGPMPYLDLRRNSFSDSALVFILQSVLGIQGLSGGTLLLNQQKTNAVVPSGTGLNIVQAIRDRGMTVTHD